MHPIALKSLDKRKHRFIWMRNSYLSRARALCRCIEHCSKPHCAGAEHAAIFRKWRHHQIERVRAPPPPCSLGLTGHLQQQHSERPKGKKRIGRNLEDIEGWEGKERVTKIYRHTEKHKPALSTFGSPLHPHVRGWSRYCSRTVPSGARALSQPSVFCWETTEPGANRQPLSREDGW